MNNVFLHKSSRKISYSFERIERLIIKSLIDELLLWIKLCEGACEIKLPRIFIAGFWLSFALKYQEVSTLILK